MRPDEQHLPLDHPEEEAGDDPAGEAEENGSASEQPDRWGWDDPDEKVPTVHGQTVVGERNQVALRDVRNNYYYAQVRPPAASGRLNSQDIDRFLDLYVEAPGLGSLVHRLRTRRVQILEGAAKSGRRSTAVAALQRLEVPIEIVDPAESANDLAGLDLKKSCGHIVESAERPGEGSLASLRDAAEAAGAYLIILVSADAPGDRDALADYLFEYEPPPAEQVVSLHLHRRLTRPLARQVQNDLSDRNSRLGALSQGWLAAAEHNMTEVVSIADKLCRFGAGDIGLENLIAQHHAEQHGVLSTWLSRATATHDGDTGRPTIWEGAFLIATAVLDGFPLHRVLAAADQLAELLHRVESPETRLSRQVFKNGHAHWKEWLNVVDPGARDRQFSGRYAAGYVPRGTQTRRVWLLSERLPAILLDLVWREFNALHQPIATWLGSLAQAKSELIRRRAASTAGTLATYDFDHVRRVTFGEWSKSSHSFLRDSAAGALAVASTDHATAPAARRTARDWANPPSGWQRQETALRAYMYGVDTPRPSDVLRVLRLSDAFPGVGGEWMPLYLGSLVDNGRGGVVLQALADWDDPRRAEVLAGLIEGGDPGRRRPALLSATGGAPPSRDALVELLSPAFLGGPTPVDGWSLLLRWVIVAGEDPALRSALSGLVRALAAEPELRRRLHFHLRLWTDQPGPPRPAASMLLRQLDQVPVGEEDAGDRLSPAV